MLASIISELKELENQGYQYEAAEASFELLMRRAMGLQRNYFKFESFRVMNHKYRMDKPPLTEATIRLFVGGNEVHTAAMGDGPVNALDCAIRKALTRFYPMPAGDGTGRLQSSGPLRRTRHRGQGPGAGREQGRALQLGNGRGVGEYHRGELAGAGGQHQL